MQTEPVHFPATPIALNMAVAISIGMLAGTTTSNLAHSQVLSSNTGQQPAT